MTQSINPSFQETGTWYDFLDNNSTLNVSNTNTTISLQPGEFKIYASSQITLSVHEDYLNSIISLIPNPIANTFKINTDVKKVSIYDIRGRLTKTFKGDFTANDTYNIKDLSPAVYIVRIDSNLGTLTKKVIKK